MEYHRFHPMGRRANSPPPPPKGYVEEDANGQQRRRVAVACARCRKRKIRCSGDPGDGTGCQNCRSAGADVRECKFNRVGSADVTVTSLGYHHEGFASTPNLPSNTVPASFGPYSRSYPNSQSISSSRIPYSGAATAGPYADGQLDHYNMPAATYSSTQDNVSVVYSLQEPIRQYHGMSEPRSSLAGRYYMEPDHSLTMRPPQPASIITAMPRPSISSTESLSPYGMSALSLNHSVRQLPPPGTARSFATPSSMDELARARRAPHLSFTSADSDARYTRHAMAWAEPPEMTRTAYQAMSTTTPPYGSVHPCTTQESVSFGYIPVSGSPEPSPATAPSLSYSGTTSSTPISTVPNLPIGPAGSSLDSSDSSNNLYALASSASASNRNSIELPGLHDQCGSSLVNGQRYTPITHPRPIHMASFEGLKRDSFTATNLQRNSTSHAEVVPASSY